jgi:hypothetical protein
MWRFRHFTGNFKDFNPFCLPLATGILAGRNPDFLSGAKALCSTFVALAYRHVFAKKNLRMAHIHATQHIVPALNENPAGGSWRVGWRINHLADKSSIRRKGRRNPDQYRERQTQHPAFHIYLDAGQELGVAS